MAGLPKRACKEFGCVEFALPGKSRCAEHWRAMENDRKRESRARNGRGDHQRLYRTRRWAELRKRKLRDQPLCEECLRFNVTKGAEVVDHVVPHRGDMALMYDYENLESLCKSCHDSKTAREDGGFGNRKRERPDRERPVEEARGPLRM